jgi:tRNA-Thr(GGU) m(6)t(6)A37 methyltransferase TsaA
MTISMKPIGSVHTKARKVPRHWTLSDIEGTLVIDEQFLPGLKDIKAGDQIVVVFHFHQSPPFEPRFLRQTPPHRTEDLGVFSICSPIRPNPIGMSVLKVLETKKHVLRVKGIDMVDGTPILDIKPYVKDRQTCPSCPD